MTKKMMILMASTYALHTIEQYFSSECSSKGEDATPTDKFEFLEELEGRLKWLLKEEMMQRLLRKSISLQHVSWIVKVLGLQEPFTDPTSCTTVILPLLRGSHEIFFKELPKACIRGSSRKIVPFGPYFMVVDQESSASDDDGEHNQTASVSSEDMEDETEFIQIDGHSVVPPSLDIGQFEFESPNDYWLILSAEASSLQVFFHSQVFVQEERELFVKYLCEAILAVCELANRLLLLQELYDSRIAR